MRLLQLGCAMASCLALLAVPLGALAAEPEVRNLNLRGLQIGGTTTLTIDGDALGKTPRLLLPFPAKQELKKSTDKQAAFEVTLNNDIIPGYYHLRLATDQGVSLPTVITVDKLPQQPLSAAVATTPVALHGALTGSGTVEAKFRGKAGQKVLIEIEAQRLGSKLRPVIHLNSPQRLQLAWAWSTPALADDARLAAVLPADGEYSVALHDAEYAGPAPGFFRLKIGEWSAVDQVFPPVVTKGQAQTLELLGPATPVKVALPAPGQVGPLPLTWPQGGAWSGPRPFVTVSAHPEFVEQSAEKKIQELPVGPVGVSGRLQTPYEEDQYRIPVTPGTKVRLEVFAERSGSPLDVALIVRNDKGAQLARGEDSPGTLDPILDYAVPANVSVLVVGVVDAQGRGGPRGVYRLVIEPQKGMTSVGDFRLLTPAQRLTLPVGGTDVVPVLVERSGYQGPITIQPSTLPAGLKLEGTTIPEGADGTLVTIERTAAAFEPTVLAWKGRAASGEERTAAVKGHPLTHLQPWLAQEIAVAPTALQATDFRIEWKNLAMDTAIVPGKKLTLPIKTFRVDDRAAVKLTLLTSQLAPLANNQPDPNKTIRQEKPVELPVKPGSTAPGGVAVNDGEITVLVPADLPAPSYDLTVQAELLAPDKKTVKATAFAPVRRLTVRPMLALKLDGSPRLEVTLAGKKDTTVKLQGKVERLEGLKSDVDLALTGLPAGVKATPVKLKADTTDFTVNLILPPNVPAGEVKGLKLSASAIADPKTPNVRVKSRDVEVTLVIRSAGK